MARALWKYGIEMKFPWKIPDGALSNKPDGSGDISKESEESFDFTDDWDDRLEYSTKQFISDWMEEMKMFLSDQISKTKLRFLKTLRAIECEVAKNYVFRRNYKHKNSLKSDPTGEYILQNCMQRYQALETFESKTPVFQTVDSPIDINRLSDLIEYMSVTQYLDSDDVCSIIDFNSLQSEFRRFCMENKKASGKLEQLDVDLRTSLSEAIIHFKLLLEYFMRDLFIITEREPQTFNERQELNRKLKLLNKLMTNYFSPLKKEMQSLACKAESFNCLKERIYQHLQEFLSMDLYNVKCIDFP